MARSDRTRNWLFEVYPESAPADWRQILDDQHLCWVESPLHQFDVNPTGETKKAHWHILIMFESLKSFDQVRELTAPCNGTIPIICHSPRGSVRYFSHLDNPEKFQYNVSEIVGHGGADVKDLLKPTASSRYSAVRDMCRYIRDYGITEFSDFLDYVMEERFDDWYPLLCDNSTMIVKEYITSNRYRKDGLYGV